MSSFLQRIRLPNRIYLIFICGFLMPMAVVIGLSSLRLENELKEQSLQRLRSETKNTAMSIMERLIQMDGELRYLIDNNPGALETARLSLPLKGWPHLKGHFHGLIYWGSQGPVLLAGDSKTRLHERPAALNRAPSEKPLLILHRVPGEEAQLFMALPFSDSSWVLGQIDAAYLLNAGAHFNLPPDTELCIFDSTHTILASTLPEPANLIQAIPKEKNYHHTSAFRWSSGQETYLASAFDLFIPSHFSGNPLTIVLSRSGQAVVGPVNNLRMNTLLTGLVVILIVLLLSSISIRRSLSPLHQLMNCARRLGEGDFSQKAEIGGSPEVKELSQTFNTMTGQIEQQLTEIRKSEERFKAAFEESPAAIALINAEGRFFKVNRVLPELLGCVQEDLLSKCLYDFIHPEERKELKTLVESGLDSGSICQAAEKRFMDTEGKIITGLVSMAPFGKNAPAAATYIVHILDVTEQKAAQIENHTLEAQLYHAQKMEAIGTLAAGIAHDFNNILSVIIGNAELAIPDVQAGTATHQNLRDILKASERAAGLTRQILSVSRSEKGEFVPIQLGIVVKEALKLLRSSIPPHISIAQNISSEPCMVNANSTQIHQLIMNLCTNSYHAMMNEGSGSIIVSLAPGRIRLSGDHEAKPYLKLSVTDTGCGMAPDVMGRIFEPYFTTKQKGQGTGLGLSIVHSIVEKHGGAIHVDSKQGLGTTFKIYFPIVDRPVEAASQALSTVPSGNESILVVDDEPDITMLWQKMLTRQGYDVAVRNHPHEALEELKNNPLRYSLVISDLAMPDMTGDQLCAEMTKINPRVPMILCTGYLEEMKTTRLCPAVKRRILKPVNLLMLAETVRSVIDHPDECSSPSEH